MPIDGLRMNVSAGANVGERLMAVGDRHYGKIRETADDWLGRVEIASDRIDDDPRSFSGGMRQRLQIARNLVTIRGWSSWTNRPAASMSRSRRGCSIFCAGWSPISALSVVIVTHDLAVARLLSHRIMVMRTAG
jgi:putative phosphonate transport system ATP-binding protein